MYSYTGVCLWSKWWGKRQGPKVRQQVTHNHKEVQKHTRSLGKCNKHWQAWVSVWRDNLPAHTLKRLTDYLNTGVAWWWKTEQKSWKEKEKAKRFHMEWLNWNSILRQRRKEEAYGTNLTGCCEGVCLNPKSSSFWCPSLIKYDVSD